MIGTTRFRARKEISSHSLLRAGSLKVIAAGLAAMAILLLPGCSTGSAHNVDPSRARDALVLALERWKLGDDPRSLGSMPSPMTVQDFEWQSGAKLIDYQLIGEGQPLDANLSVRVKLKLAAGKGKTVEKAVYYLVGTSPSVTVFRDMLRR